MRFSDWSSDVCSSDLLRLQWINRSTRAAKRQDAGEAHAETQEQYRQSAGQARGPCQFETRQFGSRQTHTKSDQGCHQSGRGECRERWCQYVSMSVGAGPFKTTASQTTKHKKHT